VRKPDFWKKLIKIHKINVYIIASEFGIFFTGKLDFYRGYKFYQLPRLPHMLVRCWLAPPLHALIAEIWLNVYLHVTVETPRVSAAE